jgi:glycosyltransferase involved in cell wall biosynthesis
MPRVLYISYWGALEQLGQSLVVPAVKQLAQMGADLTLVTFEKPADLAREDEMKRVREMFSEDGIEWIPLKYHKDPKIPATVFDIAHGIARTLQKRLTKRFDIVQGRTFIGGLAALIVAPLIGAKFVYHNEGFYPDEQVDGGVWAVNSRPHLVAKRLENLMYSRADGIIALSHRAKAIIEKLPEVARKQTPIIFVPSCVDLERFHLPETKAKFSSDEFKFVYIGSVGNRYILDKIGSFMAAARKVHPNVSLQVYSKADVGLITRMLDDGGLEREAWKVEAVPYNEMPARLANFQAGLFFLTEGISEHGCSPTKIGEYWATGLPVVTTPNVSDTDEIIRRERVGVVVERQDEKSYLQAFKELREIVKDGELSRRCRQAAEVHYALTPACERQFELYTNLAKTTKSRI